jgi:hypothetical protein
MYRRFSALSYPQKDIVTYGDYKASNNAANSVVAACHPFATRQSPVSAPLHLFFLFPLLFSNTLNPQLLNTSGLFLPGQVWLEG